MFDRPSLDNGYLWVCNAAMSAERASRIEQGLGDIRCILRKKDVSEFGSPMAAMVVEHWVHPGDDVRVLTFLAGIPTDL